MQLNLKVIKEVATPPLPRCHFYINPPFSGLSPLSSTIFGPPQVTQLLESLIPPLIRGEGGFNYGFPCLICIYDVQIIFLNYFFELYIYYYFELLVILLNYPFDTVFLFFFICSSFARYVST